MSTEELNNTLSEFISKVNDLQDVKDRTAVYVHEEVGDLTAEDLQVVGDRTSVDLQEVGDHAAIDLQEEVVDRKAKMCQMIIARTKELQNSIPKMETSDFTKINNAFVIGSKSISKLASGDWKTKLSGIMEIIAAFAPVIGGPSGTVVPMVMQVLNGILGLFEINGPSFTDMLQDMITRAFDDAHNRMLINEANGTKTLFETSEYFLNGIRFGNHPLPEQEVSAFTAQIPIWSGVKFMGILANEIETLSKPPNSDVNSTKALSDSRACVQYTTLYYQLALLQDKILTDLYTVVKASGKFDYIAGGIWSVRMGRIQTSKSVLKFLHKPGCNLTIVAEHILENDILKKAFMEFCGVDASTYSSNMAEVEGKWVSLCFPNADRRCLNLTQFHKVSLVRQDEKTSRKEFELKKADNGICYTIKSKQCPDWYLAIPANDGGENPSLSSTKNRDESTEFICFSMGEYRNKHTISSTWCIFYSGNDIKKI